jgi:uncharacterized membrane protein
MTTINVPTRDEVSPANQAIFDKLKRSLGTVPNLYATLAHLADSSAQIITLRGLGYILRGKVAHVCAQDCCGAAFHGMRSRCLMT